MWPWTWLSRIEKKLDTVLALLFQANKKLDALAQAGLDKDQLTKLTALLRQSAGELQAALDTNKLPKL